MSLWLLIVGLVLFVGLVIIHEFGHFIAARRNGVKVEEFGIGFPPKIWSKKMPSGFVLSLNLLPIGGFVRLLGENDSDERKGSFGAAGLWAKTKIILAGVGMNLAVALVIFTLLGWVGMPKIIENQFSVKSNTKVVQEPKDKDVVLVAEVIKDSPADKAGLIKDDQIISVNGFAVTSTDQLSQLTKEFAGQTVPIKIKRGAEIKETETTLNAENKGSGYLGLASVSGATGLELTRSTWSAPFAAVGLSAQLSAQTYKGLATVIGDLFKGNAKKAGDQVAGPVEVFRILKDGSGLGISFILMIIAIISLTLALFNALPIPALDGGRLMVSYAFRAFGKRPTKRAEDWIHGVGFILLMILFVLVTISDLKKG